METSIDLPKPENKQHETDVAQTRGCSGTVGIRRIAEDGGRGGEGGREEGSEKTLCGKAPVWERRQEEGDRQVESHQVDMKLKSVKER